MEGKVVFTSTGLIWVSLPICEQWIIVTTVNRIPNQITLKRLFRRLYAHTESEVQNITNKCQNGWVDIQ